MDHQDVIHILVNLNYKLDFDESVTLSGLNSYRVRVHRSVLTIPNGSFVVPRYHTYPYSQLDYDLRTKYCTSANTREQRNWVLKLANWYEILKDYTPKTILLDDKIDYPGYPVVLRSDYGTLKHLEWKNIYAENQEQLMQNYLALCRDTWHSQFEKYAREYVELLPIGPKMITGMPMTDEWRVFYLNGKRIAYGTYWPDDKYVELEQRGLDLADTCAKLLTPFVNFFAIDIGRTKTNSWIVIEVNDAISAGLQNVQSGMFYSKLFESVYVD